MAENPEAIFLLLFLERKTLSKHGKKSVKQRGILRASKVLDDKMFLQSLYEERRPLERKGENVMENPLVGPESRLFSRSWLMLHSLMPQLDSWQR